MNNELITRKELRTLLVDWKSGHRTAKQVHDWAKLRYPGQEYEDDVVIEVMAYLDMLDMNLVIADDVPVLLSVLDLAGDQAERASELLWAIDSGELDSRKRRLAADPFYAPFCGR